MLPTFVFEIRESRLLGFATYQRGVPVRVCPRWRRESFIHDVWHMVELGDAGGAKFCAQCKRKRSRTQQAQGKSKRGKIMQAQGKGKSGELLQLSFDKGGIQPWSSSTAAMAMVGSGAETPSRTARRQEGWPRSKASFDTDEAPRRRKPTSHPLQKRKRSDKDPGGPQTKRFGEGGMGSLLAGVELLAGFPLLKLPEELQMLVAAHVAAPLDRAALCIAVPPRSARRRSRASQRTRAHSCRSATAC